MYLSIGSVVGRVNYNFYHGWSLGYEVAPQLSNCNATSHNTFGGRLG